MYPLVEDMAEIYARPLPRIYVFSIAIEYSAKVQHTTTGARARGVGRRRTRGAPLLLCVERWLNIQWQAETYHIFLAEDGHTF